MKPGGTGDVSNGFFNEAYQAATTTGAEGRRLSGAGGGFLTSITSPKRRHSIRSALPPLREATFRFAAAGSNIIFVH
ncbi:MAG TPA: hypothetical protein VMX97_04695 [Hyphomicrobiaceae bacterium]|nr:hypothetical protein [Hyphomicrobiaceae bacterium]